MAVYIYIYCVLSAVPYWSRYAGSLEERPVAHDGILFMIHAQSQAFLRELFTVHKERKIADVMLKFLRVAVQRTVKICILNHGEGTQDGFVNREGFRSGRECERLEFDSCQVIGRKTARFIKRRSVTQHYGGIRPHAPNPYLGVQ